MASGGSVIGLVYNGGVFMASDTLLSYGSLAKWPNIPRSKILGKYTAVCASGDFADFQAVTADLQTVLTRDALLEDGVEMGPQEVFSYLHRTMYSKRCDFEPAMCQFVVCGSDANGESFLGVVDDIGTRWTDKCVGTGYGAHIAIPLLRRAVDNAPNGLLSRDQALSVIKDCMRGIFYRECRAINKIQIVECTKGKVHISEPEVQDTNWSFSGFAFEKTAIIR